MAARAVFALSRVGDPAAVSALARATADRRPPVRVAVAAAVSQRALVLPDPALVTLLKDPDAGVRKFATRPRRCAECANNETGTASPHTPGGG